MSAIDDLLKKLNHTPGASDVSSHTPGTRKGESWVSQLGRERGRRDKKFGRTARDSTSVNPRGRKPLVDAMPPLPPA